MRQPTFPGHVLHLASPSRPVGLRARLAGLRRSIRRSLTVALLLSPTLLATAYYGLIAADRYVAEARFVIHTASKSAGQFGGLSAFLQMIGLSRSQDDAYAVRDYLTSRDAIIELNRAINLRAIYARDEPDFVARYPSLLFPNTEEGFYRYFQHAVSVYVNTSSGMTVLEVQAFRPEDAALVATKMLELGEGLVNRLNERALQDAVRVANAEVTHAEQRRIDAQQALTHFRTQELTLDPTHNATLLVEMVGRLSEDLARTRADIAATQANAHDSPQLAAMRERAAALARQIDEQTARISTGTDGLADKIARYETLELDEQFANRALDQAVGELRLARVEARRQQLFLERVVEPVAPDQAMEPRRLRMILSVLGFNIIGVGLFWLIATGLREHAAGEP